MSTITAQQIVDRAGVILQDTTNVRWPEDELLDWVNDGQREVVLLNPSAHAENGVVQLDAGTKQTFESLSQNPENDGTNIGAGIRLTDVIRNMGTDGATEGRSVTVIERRIMDHQRPDWHTDTADSEVKHFMHDDLDPKTFYVTPPQPDSSPGYVELLYSSVPEDVELGDTLALDDVYANAILDYVLYRAYSKDADFGSAELAQGRYQSFVQAIGVKAQRDMNTVPGDSMDARERGGRGGS